MQERKLNVHFAWFVYAGNGSMASQCPELRPWWGKLLLSMSKDARIGGITETTHCDTPISMTRCKAVLDARRCGADVLVMIDSDNVPDMDLGKCQEAKPWFESSFTFIYERFDKGPHMVLAPYCGPPPHEVPYMFRWENRMSDNPNADMELAMYTRAEAAQRSGMEPVAAGPTGVSMYDMRIFDITDPKLQYDAMLKRGVPAKDAIRLLDPWFDYEWTDIYHSEKASTEDVFFTRNALLTAIQKLGYNPLYANWDAWAGHQKGKLVGKPQLLTADQVGESFREAVLSGRKPEEKVRHIELPDWLAKRNGVAIHERKAIQSAVLVGGDQADEGAA